jgi:hypothetical protein
MVGESYSTSYFSTPSITLDPKLFEGRNLRAPVRQGIMALINDFLGRKYRHPEIWSHPWLAGSAVSYQWEASRQPGDLDCLVGVNFVQFRKANPEFAGLSDSEIAYEINDDFYNGLQPTTSDWNGFELTFYVNPGGSDIRDIKPYAAYDLKYDEWTVTPSPVASPPAAPSWETAVGADKAMASQISNRYLAALNSAQVSTSEATRRNAETNMKMSMEQAINMYEDIHMGRRLAFSTDGEGYADYHNYRWQAAKREGIVQQLKPIRDKAMDVASQTAHELYGVDLPDTTTLIRRAALYGKRPQ